MATRQYKYEHKTSVDVDAIAVDDGDVILCVKNYPLSMTLYMHADQARAFAQQVLDAANEAEEAKNAGR
jgi:hypothetical protein